ncbi:unnamed protein product [Linum trigynum]|uniref:Uncharacterized protein n=1 Tax=Linum trigynum TaxID=586398 RepID=A0AAV2F8X3_9ROSI
MNPKNPRKWRFTWEDDHNWLEELLQAIDKDMDGSDGVVVVGEYTPPKLKLKSCRSSKLVRDFEDDDDCVILDGDPDKPDQPVKDTATVMRMSCLLWAR